MIKSTLLLLNAMIMEMKRGGASQLVQAWERDGSLGNSFRLFAILPAFRSLTGKEGVCLHPEEGQCS